jgi:predicted nucleotidyltransferase
VKGIYLMSQIYSVDEIKNIIHSFDNILKSEYKADKFYLFGSYVRGEQTSDSDIDLLVEFTTDADLFSLIDLKEFLNGIFNKNIDLGTPNGLKPRIKNSILNEAILI